MSSGMYLAHQREAMENNIVSTVHSKRSKFRSKYVLSPWVAVDSALNIYSSDTSLTMFSVVGRLPVDTWNPRYQLFWSGMYWVFMTYTDVYRSLDTNRWFLVATGFNNRIITYCMTDVLVISDFNTNTIVKIDINGSAPPVIFASPSGKPVWHLFARGTTIVALSYDSTTSQLYSSVDNCASFQLLSTSTLFKGKYKIIWDGGRYIVVGDFLGGLAGGAGAFTSTDLVTWSRLNSKNLVDIVSWGGNYYGYDVYAAGIWKSIDAVTWASNTSTASNFVFAGNAYVFGLLKPSGGVITMTVAGKVTKSYDGVTWEFVTQTSGGTFIAASPSAPYTGSNV